MSTRSITSRSVLVAGAAVLSMTAAVFVLKRLHDKRSHSSSRSNSNSNNSNNKNNDKSTPTITKQVQQQEQNDTVADPQLTDLFNTVARESKSMPWMTRLSNTERLILYGLYKQSTLGDAPTDRPLSGGRWSMNVVENAKYDSWARIRGMSRNSAMIHYLEAVQHLQQSHGNLENKNQTGSSNADSSMEDLDMDGAEGLMGNTRPSSLANNEDDDGDGYHGQDLTLEQQMLRAASQNDVTTLSSILRQHPELIHHKDEDGQSALHLAADKGASQALELLLQAGANVNAADADGITCLHAAVIAENLPACRILLRHGADPDLADADGDTPRSCAQEDGSDEMKQMFANLV